MRTFIVSMAAALLAIGAAANSASAIERCGGSRSCHGCGKSNCQLVCEMKTVKKSCWVIECEQMCPLLPSCSKSCGRSKSCGSGCGGCGEDACGTGCGKGCCSKPLVPPKCGKMRTVKKLVKKEYEVKVPVYKCKACGGCGGCGIGEEAARPAVPAPAPAVTKAPMPPTLRAAPLPPTVMYGNTSR